MRSLATVIVATILLACGKVEVSAPIEAGNGADASPAPGTAPPGDGPYGITCRIYHRDLGAGETQHEERSLDFRSDVDDAKSVVLRGVTFEASVRTVETSPGDALVQVAVREAFVTQEVRLSRTKLPAFEFSGAHGFSGLLYTPLRVGNQDVQYICVARPFERRPPADSRERERKPPVPVHVRCDVQHRPDADAGVDREESVELTGAGERIVDFGDTRVFATLHEDDWEPRSMILSVGPAPTSNGVFWSRQLLQIDKTVPLPNLFGAEHGFTGRVTVGSPSGASISYVCRTLEQ